MTPSQYRYDTVREFSMKLKTLAEEYQVKIKKYQRRITVIDVTVYSVSGVMAGAGIILSSVTMIASVAVPICISAATTIAGVATAITKKLSCSQIKLNDYTVKHHIVSNAHSQLSTMISSSIDDSFISDDEFSAMVRLYDSTMSKLESNFNDFNNNNNNNNDNVRDIVARTASTNSGEYRPGENSADIGGNEDAGVQH
jgi:hypothetical protein